MKRRIVAQLILIFESGEMQNRGWVGRVSRVAPNKKRKKRKHLSCHLLENTRNRPSSVTVENQ